MPYLKIKTANGTDNDWTIVNNLTLNKLTVEKDGIEIKKDGITTTTTITADGITSNKINATNININNQTLNDYIIGVTGGTIGSITIPPPCVVKKSAPTSSDSGESGQLWIEVSNGYSLLWYHNGSTATAENNPWVRVNAIWG